MEYVFGFVTREEREIENLKTINEVAELTGAVELVTTYDDAKITDSCSIVEKYDTKTDVEGNFYSFYEVRNHIKRIEITGEDVNEAVDDLIVTVLGGEESV